MYITLSELKALEILSPIIFAKQEIENNTSQYSKYSP